MTSKFFKFFASKKGQQYVFVGSTIASISVFTLNYIPHNLLLFKYREIVASYQNGVERSVSEALKRKFEIAANLVKLTNAERELVEPFMVSGFDLYSIGSTNFRSGALIGIPVNYTYTAANEIPKTEVTVKGYDQVKWTSEGGQLLEESLILNEKEQIFGIAREMLDVKKNTVLINSLLASGSIVFYYAFTSTINSKEKLFSRPRSLRYMVYSILSFFTVGMYIFLKDTLQVYTERQIDEELAKLDKEYVEAGIGFYDKICKKNIAIRHLTGNNDFTALGNLNNYIRTPSMPFTIRKSYFEDVLKKLNANNESS